MIPRVVSVLLFASAMAAPVRSAEEPRKSSMKELLKARIAEDARKAEAKKPAAAASPATTGAGPTHVGGSKNAAPATKPQNTPKADGIAVKEAPTVMPKVEVRKGRITELDQKLAKQEQDIARERKNIKATEVDSALNDAKIARPLAIFGGESSQFRQRVASERVELMEAEKDLIEAIDGAKTKAEKQELQKQLNELRMVRRELEKSLR